jgi:glycerate kinase
MKIVIAPDSFKGSMRSPQVCEVIAAGIREKLPEAELVLVPMADGGEGTTEAAVVSTGGRFVEVKAMGPLGAQVNAAYGILDGSRQAVIELVARQDLNPLKATTYGTGQLMRAIIESGIRDIVIGIGGSATNDGGAGMAQALGYRFLDASGNELQPGIGGGRLSDIASIDTSGVIDGLGECRIRVACDVTNPLLGPNGASAVYGPQKGATPELVKQLDTSLAHYAEVLTRAGLAESCKCPGDGAAGGLGFGLRVLTGAQICSGAGMMIETTGLKQHLEGADLVITGEGCSDSQTVCGKLCAVVAATAAEFNVPTILLSGAILGGSKALGDTFAAAFSIANRPMSLDEAIAATEENLYDYAKNIASMLHTFNC